MQDSFLHNPYAPPRAEVSTGWRPASPTQRPSVDLAEALRRLNEHVGNPGNVEADLRAMGGRFRRVSWVVLGLGALMLVASVALYLQQTGFENDTLPIVGAVTGGVFAVLGVLLLALDLSLVARNKPSSPDKTLKAWFKAISMARYGYAWAALCPTAREQVVASPDLPPIQTSPGQFSLANEKDLKAYLTSFARSSGAVLRVMGAKRVVLGHVERDVAELAVELRFQSWPRWVSIVAGVGFFVFRPLALVGIVAYFATRKRRVVHVTKTLLRAENGVWYVYDGNVLEGAAAT